MDWLTADEAMSGKADSVLSRADKLLADNSGAINSTVANVNGFSKTLNDNRANVDATDPSVGERASDHHHVCHPRHREVVEERAFAPQQGRVLEATQRSSDPRPVRRAARAHASSPRSRSALPPRIFRSSDGLRPSRRARSAGAASPMSNG